MALLHEFLLPNFLLTAAQLIDICPGETPPPVIVVAVGGGGGGSDGWGMGDGDRMGRDA